jgi:hypothetical protein
MIGWLNRILVSTAGHHCYDDNPFSEGRTLVSRHLREHESARISLYLAVPASELSTVFRKRPPHSLQQEGLVLSKMPLLRECSSIRLHNLNLFFHGETLNQPIRHLRSFLLQRATFSQRPHSKYRKYLSSQKATLSAPLSVDHFTTEPLDRPRAPQTTRNFVAYDFDFNDLSGANPPVLAPVAMYITNSWCLAYRS